MIDTRTGLAPLLQFVSDQTLPKDSLLELTGDEARAKIARFASGLEKRVAGAWVTPMADLTCGQCRMLVGQRLGLAWLAAPVASFVTRYPQAECDLYPGDLTTNALLAWQDMARHAPEETAGMLALDYDWLRREADEEEWERGIMKQAVAALNEACASQVSAWDGKQTSARHTPPPDMTQ